MDADDKLAHLQMVELLSDKKRTPLFMQMLEDFVHVTVLKNPAFKERLLEIRSLHDLPILKPFPLYKAESLLPPLDMVWMQAVQARLPCDGQVTSFPVYGGNTMINNDLRRMSPGLELNDNIVNGYLNLVREKFSIPNNCFIASTYILTSSPPRELSNTIQGYSGVLIPVFQSYHWTFAHLEIHVKGLSLSYYDSLTSKPVQSPPRVMKWIRSMFPGSSIKMKSSVNPQQMALSNDCGVLMLIGIRLIASGERHLSQDEANVTIPLCRHRILAEILANRLDPTPQDYHRFIEDEQRYQHYEKEGLVVPPPHDLDIDLNAGNEIENPITFADTPTKTPLSSVGNGEAFMGASSLTEPLPPILLAQNSLEPRWPDNILEDGEDGEAVTEITKGLDLEAAHVPQGLAKGEACTKKRKNIEQADEVEGAACAISQVPEVKLPSQSRLSVAPSPREVALACAYSFAEEKTIIEVLRQAVHARRIVQNVEILPKKNNLALLWSSLEAEDARPRTLQSRHNRQLFSHQFLARFQHLCKGGKKGQAKTILKKEIGINDYGTEGTRRWRLAYGQATRAKIWTELSDVFLATLGPSRFVALCATSESTSAMEALNTTQRRAFLDAIQLRLAQPDDKIVYRLRAASALYSALIEESLPVEPLCIEKWLPHWPLRSTESFEEIVGLTIAPSRRALPARLHRKNL